METVLITGCSSGIGEATARAFLDEDWWVYATARDPGDIVDLEEAGCETAALDVTDADEIESVVDRITEEAGRIDTLVNNAGYGQYGPIEDVPTREVHRQFDVNVYGPHRLTRAVLPYMRDREEGRIINVSSVFGRISTPTAGVYAGSKHALEAMSEALRAEVSGFGIDVVVVAPDSVRTRFHDRAATEAESRIERSDVYARLYRLFDDARTISHGSPFASEPEAVARVILNAASCTEPESRYTVGPFAKWAPLFRFVPDRWRDATFRTAARLAR